MSQTPLFGRFALRGGSACTTSHSSLGTLSPGCAFADDGVMSHTEQYPPTPNPPQGHYISRNQLYIAIAIGVALVLAAAVALGAAFGSSSTASGGEALPPVQPPSSSSAPSTEPPSDTIGSSIVPPADTAPPSTEPLTGPAPTTPPPAPAPTTPPPPLPTIPPTVPPTVPPPPPPTTTEPPATTEPPEPELSQIVVEVTRIVGEASLHLDGKRIGGTGRELQTGAESIDRINLTDLLEDSDGRLVLDFWKFPCWGAEFKINFYVDGEKDDSSDSMRDCVSDLNWAWEIDPVAGTITRT